MIPFRHIRSNFSQALMIANGAACNTELLKNQLAQNPYILVLDGALPRILELDIIPHAWLGDFDSEQLVQKHRAPASHFEIIHTPDQNKTDFEKGLEYLINAGFNTIHVIWATGRRADHTLANLYSLAQFFNVADITLWDDHSKIFLLPYNYIKNYTPGTPLSLMPINKATGVTTSGLKYNMNNETLQAGIKTSGSNESNGFEPVQINYNSGIILMMECNDKPAPTVSRLK